ncbi:MAG: alpha-L-fucosidase [Phycisphaerae bacterium]|nr:alpha-L-fucosidase [Phycisphaerae bacterium]
MKPKKLCYLLMDAILLAAMAVFATSCSSTKQGGDLTVEQANDRKTVKLTKDEKLKWWRDAHFGMMITWGAYSEAGGYWKGKYEGGYSEWLKFRGISNAEYDALIKSFNPVDFDAEEWVKIAKNAGMKYMVIMAKHHDGFAMYDSAVTDYDIVDMTDFGRDPIGELVEACHKAGLKFGVYYSVDRDWHHPDAACDDKYKQCNKWDYPENASGGMDRWHNSYFANFAVEQVRELVTQYPLDILWFDGIDLKTEEEVALLESIIYTARPNCLINSRITGFVPPPGGDYLSTSDNGVPDKYQPGGWENPGTFGFSYGYSVHDKFKSPRQVLHMLIEIVSKGGNYLLNVGPDGQGRIIPKAQDILKEMGAWLDRYGTSIYGADGLAMVPPDNILFTAKPHQLFVHVLDWNDQQVKIEKMDKVLGVYLDRVHQVYMLADDQKRPLEFQVTDGTLTINLSSCPFNKSQRNKYAEVIVVSDGK